MSHTPGPYDRDGRFVYKLVPSSRPSNNPPPMVNLWLCSVQPCGEAVPTEELEAVAQLFKAAPDLKEALKELVAAQDANDEGWFDSPKMRDVAMEKARAALAKCEPEGKP